MGCLSFSGLEGFADGNYHAAELVALGQKGLDGFAGEKVATMGEGEPVEGFGAFLEGDFVLVEQFGTGGGIDGFGEVGADAGAACESQIFLVALAVIRMETSSCRCRFILFLPPKVSISE